MQATQRLSEYEAERGKPIPSRNHSLAQTNLIVALTRGGEHSILSELTLDLPKELTPDISIYPRLPVDWRHDEIRMSEVPTTVIEIPSPTQRMDELSNKADAYFAAGVRSAGSSRRCSRPSRSSSPTARPGHSRAVRSETPPPGSR